jgi:hypothetical protein
VVGVQACKAAAEDMVVDACHEEDELPAERSELIAIAAGQSLQKALADQAAEVVGHLAHAVRVGQVLLDQKSQVSGVEAAEDAAELTQGTEQRDHARVAESESGSAPARFAGGHDQGLEEAGGGCWPTAVAFHLEQATVDVAAQLDEAGQVLQLAADPEVVGVVEGGLGTEGAVELPVLLEAGVPVTDLQAGVDVLRQNAGASGRLAATACKAAVED